METAIKTAFEFEKVTSDVKRHCENIGVDFEERLKRFIPKLKITKSENGCSTLEALLILSETDLFKSDKMYASFCVAAAHRMITETEN